jgi:hypothetical protein
MKSEFFSMFGIPPTECEIEARKDELGVPRLWFRSTGNPLVSLDLTGATQLHHLLMPAKPIRRTKLVNTSPKRSTFDNCFSGVILQIAVSPRG